MSIITQTSMPFICLPLDEFGISNLDKANSTYTEDNLLPGIPVATSVAGDHELFTTAEYNGLTDSITGFIRVADSSGGTIGGSDPARFIWRDTSEATPSNHWYGWQDYDTVTDIWSINEAAGGGSNQHQHPRAALGRDGTIITAYKQDTRVGVTRRLSGGTRTDFKSTTTAAVLASQNGSTANADHTEPDIVYVEEDNKYYLFWPSFNSGKTRTSIGVSVSSDGTSWTVITTGILPLDDSDCLTYTAATTPDTEIQRPRAIWNPISKTFTIAFQYHNGTDEYVYYVTTDKGFSVQNWTTSYQYAQCHDLVVDPITGIEYLFYFADNDTEVQYRYKDPGAATFSSSIAQITEANFNTSVGIAAWIGHNGQPWALWSDTTNEEASLYQITPTGSLSSFGTAAFEPWVINNTASRLEHISALKYRDKVLLFGNPQAVLSSTEDEILALHLGGWSNIPMTTGSLSYVTPWDVPDDLNYSFDWTENITGAPTTLTPTFSTDLVFRTTVTNAGNDVYYSATKSSAVGSVGVIKMKLLDGLTLVNTGTSTLLGYAYFDLIGYTGAQRSRWRLLISEGEFNVYDVVAAALVGTDKTYDATSAYLYVAYAYDTATYGLRLWYGSDGQTWTEAYDVTLSNTADVTAAAVAYEWGTRGFGVATTDALWQFMRLGNDTGSTASTIIGYADETETYSNTIALTGMPLSGIPNYVTKGLEVYATGSSALVEDYWSVNSVSSTGIPNALYGGPESPRIKWETSDDTPASAVLNFDFSESVSLGSGFIYIDSSPPIGTVTVAGTDTGGTPRTLVNAVSTAQTLTANYTRRGHTLYPTSAGSSVRWFEKDELAGSYWLETGALYKIASNTAGYWSSTNGDQRMIITLSGSVGAAATSGSSIVIHPKRVVLAWQNSDPFYAFSDITVTLAVAGTNIQYDVSSVWLGRFKPLPVHPQAGRSRGRAMNHQRNTSPGGFSTGRILGPDARTRTFSVVTNEGPNKWTESSAVSSNTVSINGTDELADAWSVYDTIQEAAVDYGRAKPIVWIDKVTTTPGATGAVIARFNRILMPCYMNVDNIEVSATGQGAFDGEILQVSTVQLVEIV